MAPKRVIFGCAGLALEAAEVAFFAAEQPLGFILFRRNCNNPDQVRRLVAELRASVGRADAPVLIDQEGGRVQRLQPPHWRKAPPAAVFGALAAQDPAAAEEAVRLNARLLAAELHGLGITVDCVPCLDLRRPEGHAVIGDRAFADDPALVARLGRAQAEALLAGGVLPVIKHLPGHGRAGLDSHHALPVVDAGLDELAATDFAPFHALRDLPIGMTAHIVYSALDAAPATQSAAVVAQVIRGRIGFDGLLLTDDLNMQALSGDLADRARHSLAAGCDVVLHCSGVLGEMQQVAPVVEPLEGAALTRWQRAALLLKEPEAIDAGALQARLTALLPAGPAAI